MRPAARWYVDADTIGLAKALAHVRSDVTFPGDDGQRSGSARRWLPASPVQDPATPDEEWIETVTRVGMVVITRDRKIMSRLNEVQAVRRHGARVFAIAQAPPLNTWHLLEVVVTQWRRMEAIVDSEPGPWIYLLTRTGEPRRALP